MAPPPRHCQSLALFPVGGATRGQRGDEATGCAQVTGQSQPQSLRPPGSESQSMPQNHRESRSVSNPLQDHPFQENLLQENPLQEISSLLEVCGEALDQAAGCWCQPAPGQLHPAELLCEVKSSAGSGSGSGSGLGLGLGRTSPLTPALTPADEGQLGDGEDWRPSECAGAGPPVHGALMGGATVGGATVGGAGGSFWI